VLDPRIDPGLVGRTVENTIGAFALVKELYPDATLVIAGQGSREPQLRALASKHTGITFLGAIDQSQLPAVYAAADIFVNSSILDNQPVSILEAFAAGVPVVTTAPGDLRHMVRDGETGVLVPPGDPRAMAAAAATLFDQPERARRIAERARREAERHAWTAVRDDWMRAYGREAVTA